MFSKIKAWFASWFSEEGKSDLFLPKERLIYRYFDGQKIVAADPLELYLRVMDVGPELAIDTQIATSQLAKLSDVAAAHRKRVDKIRKIFNLKLTEEGGLTGLEVAELLDHFLIWESQLKKNSNQPPILPAPTSVATSSTSEDASATKNSSVSGSTVAEPSIAPLVLLPMEPASPSACLNPAPTTSAL